jgi:large subunit ribosomal protein L31
MQADIHPTVNPVIFRDANAKKDFFMTSTMTSDETEEHNGVKYFVVRVDVSSASHPFYTGKQNILDTSGRGDKFRAKLENAQALKS